MKDRPPYKLKNTIRVYNIFQIFACTVFVTKTYMLGFDFRFLWRCEKFSFLSDRDIAELYFGTWMFLLLRLFEFVETIFFILRKKNNQASFLHIYHHVSTVILMWIFITFDTGKILSGLVSNEVSDHEPFQSSWLFTTHRLIHLFI